MLNLYFQIFFTILIVVDPIGLVPLFLSKTSDQESEKDSSSIAVFPLAIPMIAGPGAVAGH